MKAHDLRKILAGSAACEVSTAEDDAAEVTLLAATPDDSEVSPADDPRRG